MNLRLLALAPAILLTAACSGTVSTGSPSSVATPTGGASRIEVTLSDSFTMQPADMTVKAGQPVTFVVTNSGAIQHEFVLGDEAAQAAHEKEMSGGGMAMDEPGVVVLKAGETKEFTWTFPAAGSLLAGCHESGHYGAGMKATITVTD